MTPQEVFNIGMKAAEEVTDELLRKHVSYHDAFDPQIYNYKFLPGLIKALKPAQVVELGGAMGVMVGCIASCQPEETKLYSITLEEHGLEFSMCKDYPNVIKVVGDDLILSSWPKDVDLSQTDIWYIDSNHNYEQVHAELELYGPFMKKGAVVCFDDIHINNGTNRAWNEVSWPKLDTPIQGDKVLHHTGWGICVVG